MPAFLNRLVHACIGITILATLGTTLSAREPAVVKRIFENPQGLRVGKVWIMNDPDGPDAARFEFYRLRPESAFGLHLTNSAVRGSVPTVFMGQFRTDRDGAAQLMLMTEILDAYIVVNQVYENDDGIAITGIDARRPPGAVGNGGNTVPLIYFRVYSIKPGAITRSLFGPDELTDGGDHVASTVGTF